MFSTLRSIELLSSVPKTAMPNAPAYCAPRPEPTTQCPPRESGRRLPQYSCAAPCQSHAERHDGKRCHGINNRRTRIETQKEHQAEAGDRVLSEITYFVCTLPINLPPMGALSINLTAIGIKCNRLGWRYSPKMSAQRRVPKHAAHQPHEK